MKEFKQIIIAMLLAVYTAAMFGGHLDNLKRVYYSTTAPSGFAAKSNHSRPLDLRPHWTYYSQLPSSDKIQVPSEALTEIIEFPVYTEFLIVSFDLQIPDNLQPLSFPSKPRDPPVI